MEHKEEFKECEEHFTGLAKLKARQNGVSTWLYWEDHGREYYVTAYRDGHITYTLK